MNNRTSVLIAVLGLHAAAPALFAQPISTEAWYAGKDPSGVQAVRITCGPNFIDPREVVVRKGVPVHITVEALGDEPQTFGFAQPGFPPRVPVTNGVPAAHFVPAAPGRSAMSCERAGNAPALPPQAKARKQGVLTVID